MNILACYDGSNIAKDALALARDHAKAFGATVFLVRSMEGGIDVPKRDFDTAEHELEELAERFFGDADISCKPQLLVRGMSAGEDLVQFAREHAIDEMVIGIRRRSKVGKLIFGSTAQYVILEADCPVVSIK